MFIYKYLIPIIFLVFKTDVQTNKLKKYIEHFKTETYIKINSFQVL